MLRNFFGVADHNALRRGEVVVGIAPVGAGDAIARPALNAEEILVVGVATAGLRLGRRRLHLRQAEVRDAAHMALLASDLLVVELPGHIRGRARPSLKGVLLDRERREHEQPLERFLRLRREVVHKPHHSLVAVGIAHAQVLAAAHLRPVRLHLCHRGVHGVAAIAPLVDTTKLQRGVGMKLPEQITEAVRGPLLASLQLQALPQGQMLVQPLVRRGQRPQATVVGTRNACARTLQVGLP
mmetsp:Transcript_105144/g.234619  ORF Transcript_105144/g.234619 Transcript_105144/m.234619 type:complete len:240 (+) Transcript_105144:953-1672(+)